MKKIIIMFLIVFEMVFNITFAETTTTALPDASVDTTSVIKQPLECINLTYSLKYKDKDINRKGEVTILQKFLKDKGYLNVSPTGYFGTLTLKAVKNFQKANGINQTGLVGSITRGEIKASCENNNSSAMFSISDQSDLSDNFFTINTLNTNNITTTSLYVNAITTYNPWPPKVESSVERYSCSLSHTEMSDTIEKIVNGHTYCITTQTESAAGSTYRTYTYKTFGIQGTSLKTIFTLRYSNCGNYDGVSEKGDACRYLQKNINVDSIVDSLMY